MSVLLVLIEVHHAEKGEVAQMLSAHTLGTRLDAQRHELSRILAMRFHHTVHRYTLRLELLCKLAELSLGFRTESNSICSGT